MQHQREPSLVVEKPKLYAYRFVNLLVYFMLNAAVSCVWASIAIIQPTLETVYSVDANSALLLTNIFYFLYIPGTLMSAVLLSRYGFRATTITGGCVICLATLCRALGGLGPSFPVQVTGAVLGGIAQPLVLNGCSQLSAAWFGDTERNAATMLGETVPAAFGGAVLGLASSLFQVATASQLTWYFWGICMLAGATTLAFILLYRAEPPTPPSFRVDREEGEKPGVFDSLKLFKNTHYCLLVFIIGADYSFICTFPAFLFNLFYGVGYSDGDALSYDDTSIATFLFGGIIGALVAGFAVDYLKQRDVRYFQWTIVMMNVCIVGFMLVFLLSCHAGNGKSMMWLVSAMSFFATGVIPVGIEAAAEISFPMPEGASAGYLIMMGNLIAAITIESTQTSNFPTATMWSTFGISVLALIASLFFRPKYKRTLFEQAEKVRGRPMKPSLDAPLLSSAD